MNTGTGLNPSIAVTMNRSVALDISNHAVSNHNPAFDVQKAVPRTPKAGHILHDQHGRFFLVLKANRSFKVVRELSRRVYDRGGGFAGFTFGHIGPDKSRFIPGSQPVRTRAKLKAWPGGRLHALWIEASLPETCGPHELQSMSVPFDVQPCRLPVPTEAAA